MYMYDKYLYISTKVWKQERKSVVKDWRNRTATITFAPGCFCCVFFFYTISCSSHLRFCNLGYPKYWSTFSEVFNILSVLLENDMYNNMIFFFSGYTASYHSAYSVMLHLILTNDIFRKINWPKVNKGNLVEENRLKSNKVMVKYRDFFWFNKSE